MKARIAGWLAVVAVVLAGCAAPQKPIAFQQEAIAPNAGRIGVAMTPLPKADTFLPGADCLLCLAAASLANSALTKHAQTLPHDDLPALKVALAQAIRKTGTQAIVIAEDIDLSKLADHAAKGENIALKDFSGLRQKHEIDKLLVIQIDTLGFVRTYSSYIPTSDPKARLTGVGYLVDLKTNAYQWYEPVHVVKSSDHGWDEPPTFPGLTNAYFQALEIGKDRFLQSFVK